MVAAIGSAALGEDLEPVTAESLYRRHRQRIERLCVMLLGNREEARDVAQEVFLRVIEHYGRPDEPRDWSAWITRVAINACHDRRRSGWWKWWQRDGRELTDADLIAAGPEEHAMRIRQRRAIWRAMRGLSERQREVFVFRRIEGWSTAETAEALELSLESVKLHLFRAMRRMRLALRSER
jgi:RNA polymerase sigma-70 factor, ECF subfamily